MLDVARRIDRTGARCTFVHNDSPDLGRFPDDHVDLVYSVLVLQHLPRPVIDTYLAELLRVLRPDGTAVIQVPTRTLWTVRGIAWRVAPFPVLRWVQRRLLGYPAPMRMTVLSDVDFTRAVARIGGQVVARRADPTDSRDFHLTRYVIRHASGT
jgi:ubiquinone/menaquinone biosynthesis C-methylase UbiE